jgi:hypothetical protein
VFHTNHQILKEFKQLSGVLVLKSGIVILRALAEYELSELYYMQWEFPMIT